ncbi:MAG: ATP-binding cassette domain-containing protein [Spirochaetales bacterium]|nr:ATP-binding cassette domain-containing protein [Spirochaetales bacterium]
MTSSSPERAGPVLTLSGWLLALLWIAFCLYVLNSPIVPSPALVGEELIRLLGGPLWLDLFYTTMRSSLAFFLALVAGILWSATFASSQRKEALALPLLMLLQASPVLLWIVPLVLFLGSGHAAPIVAAWLVVLPLVALEFRAAFSLTTQERKDFWRHYAPDRRERLGKRLRYEWQPHLQTVTGLGLLLAFKASLIAEWFGAQNGLGRLMQQAFLTVQLSTFLALSASFLFTALGMSALARRALSGREKRIPSHLPAPVISFPGKKKILRLNHVSFSYGTQNILVNADLTLSSGEWLQLRGPSGCGKTTLLRLIAGLLKPRSGHMEYFDPGKKVASFLFQSDFLFPSRNVFTNCSFFLPEADKGRALPLLEQVGLPPHLPAAELSGGMRRRLALARALLQNTPLLLLDEPFNGLDGPAVAQLIEILKERQRQGQCILLISHQTEISGVSRELFLREGTLVENQHDPDHNAARL